MRSRLGLTLVSIVVLLSAVIASIPIFFILIGAVAAAASVGFGPGDPTWNDEDQTLSLLLGAGGLVVVIGVEFALLAVICSGSGLRRRVWLAIGPSTSLALGLAAVIALVVFAPA